MSDHPLLGTDRQERVFLASGREPTKTVTLTVRLGVPLWANAEDVAAEYVRWLADDTDDALRGTQFTGADGNDVPFPDEAADDENDDDDEVPWTDRRGVAGTCINCGKPLALRGGPSARDANYCARCDKDTPR